MEIFLHRFKQAALAFALALVISGCAYFGAPKPEWATRDLGQPNFLLVITDDQSWAHTSFAGYPAVKTPHFDRIASEGIYFNNAYASAPTCTASRSALLTGQHFWRLGPASQLWGHFPEDLVTYQKILQKHGYKIGYSAKGWGPGNAPAGNPAGPGFNVPRANPDPAFTKQDQVESLKLFLSNRKPGQPFSYWVSPTEPHIPFHTNIGRDSGAIDMKKIVVPPFLPDQEPVRNDFADYLYEIQWFDDELGRILQLLAEQGELDNTIIVVTSDNGMPFARAKSNNYEYGTHVPLAVRWGRQMTSPQRVDDFISLADLAPTFLDLADIRIPRSMTGKSFRQQLLVAQSGQVDPVRDAAYSGFERHIGNARLDGHGYPSRAIHTGQYLYIRNFAAARWPAGRPPDFEDIDDGSQSKDWLVSFLKSYESAWQTMSANPAANLQTLGLQKTPADVTADPGYALILAGAKRPTEELYDIQQDPGQLYNLAANPAYKTIKQQLAKRLADEMKNTDDPWSTGDGAIFDTYEYYGR